MSAREDVRPYEVMIVLEPGLEEEAVRALADRFTGSLAAAGASVGQVERWGKRRLAYEISHYREGHYVLVDANGPPAVLAELDRTLHLADEVLRHKVMRVPEKVAGRARRRVAVPQPATEIAADGAASAS